LRTYTLRVGTMAEAVKLYQEIGFPALQKGKHDKKLLGYFQADTGRSTRLCTCGSSTMMLIVGRIGRLFMRIRILLRASRQSFGRC
jgi:NIPSNAP protein